MKRHLLQILFIAIISLIALTGCGKQEIKPVAINEKTDKCEICNMQVKDNPYTTELILENGKSLVFDDIGCMNKWMTENKDKEIAQSFVRDYHTSDWIEMDRATYVFDKAIKTPMAYNVISFTDKQDAQKFIDENAGSLLAYEDLTQHTWEMNKVMKEEMKNMNMGDHSENEEMEMESSDHSQ